MTNSSVTKPSPSIVTATRVPRDNPSRSRPQKQTSPRPVSTDNSKSKYRQEVPEEQTLVCEVIDDGESAVIACNLSPPSPVPMKNQSKDVFSMVASASLEHQLVKYGYNSDMKIVVEENGQPETKFIRATDRNCNQVYIYVDTEGYTIICSDETSYLDDTPSSLPFSVRQGLPKLLTKDFYGVALEAGDSVCILHVDGCSVIEHRYRFNANYAGPITSDEGFTPYPIIRMSDVFGASTDTLASTAEAVALLNKDRYKELYQDMIATGEAITAMGKDYAQCAETLGSLYPQITASLNSLYQWNDYYIKYPPTSESEKMKYQDIRHNIYIRREYMSSLFRCMSMINSCKKQVDGMISLINESHKYANEKIIDIDLVIPR